ncbi:hypothetical protein [Streptomyces sp. NPDC051561]|uniref:DUF6197 family protein n=1 Tax=Streptomyces sp. NPDC051561 TaxID=3365658 RepID=UPI0037938379
MPQMPEYTTTLSPTPPALTAVFSDETLTRAAELAADAYRPLWVGPSGEESSGELVARHLEATSALLDKDGWVRAYDYSKDWSTGANLAADDSQTVEQMVRSLVRFVREDSGPGPQRSLSTALGHIGVAGAHGDPDTAYIASEVMNFVVQAHTGSDSARVTPWSERKHRTHADITALLMASARFARLHGPAGQEPEAS